MNSRPVVCMLSGGGLGLVLGTVVQWPWLDWLVPVCLFMMLFPAMMQMDPAALKRITDKPLPFLAALLTNMVLAPLIIWGLTSLAPSHVDTAVLQGLTLFGLIPCGSMIPAFTIMSRGNVTLVTAIMAASMLLGVVAVPMWSGLILGSDVGAPMILLKQMLVVIVVPFVLAQVLKRYLAKLRKERAEAIRTGISLMPGIGLFWIGFIMFLRNGNMVIQAPELLLWVGAPAITHLMLLLGLALGMSWLLRLSREDNVAYMFACTTRNIAASMALAAATFGELTTLIVVMTGPFVQMPFVITQLNVQKRRADKAKEALDAEPEIQTAP